MVFCSITTHELKVNTIIALLSQQRFIINCKKTIFSFEEFYLCGRLKIMTIKETIETEYKNALKSKDKIKISTYRLILSSIKDLDIANRSGPNKKDTDDDDIKKLLKKITEQIY